MTDHYHGYSHPVLHLSPWPTTNLFTEMDEIADELRENVTFNRDDAQIAFRQLQKVRMPNLSKNEWLELFGLWCDHYRARLQVELDETRARRDGVREELRKTTPRQEPFRCVCGEVLDDPFAPGVMEIHQPHVIAASLDRLPRDDRL